MIQKTSTVYPTIKSQLEERDLNTFTLTVNPLLPGYGHTLGNSLRRILLSSIPGFAVTKIRINEITHEYQAIDGVLEDAMNVILNLKLLRTKILTDDDTIIISLNKNKKGDVYAKDFNTEKKAEIINPDLYICHLSKDMDLKIEIEIQRGVGYLPVEKINFAGNLNPQDILVDALFSPVTNVSLNVEKVRVGERTDFDKLELNYTVDGSQPGIEIANFALDFVTDLFSQIKSSLSVDTSSTDEIVKVATKPKPKTTNMDLEDEIMAILEKNGITNLAELLEKRSEIEDFAGMTKKRIEKVKNYLDTIK